MDVTNVRTIVYFWWRKAEADLRIIKFGDHTEPLSNQNWYASTEKYIQRTAAPRESNTWKKTIEYQIFDVTEYAKKVNRNYRCAKVDNYITRYIGFEKYRLGQTDQFELPKFGPDFNDFINKVRDTVYGNHTSSKSLPICMSITPKALDQMKDHEFHEFNYQDPVTIMTFAMSFLPDKIYIKTVRPQVFRDIIAEYTAFNNYCTSTVIDGRFSFADKKILITEGEIPYDGYNFVILDESTLRMKLS